MMIDEIRRTLKIQEGLANNKGENTIATLALTGLAILQVADELTLCRYQLTLIQQMITKLQEEDAGPTKEPADWTMDKAADALA